MSDIKAEESLLFDFITYLINHVSSTTHCDHTYKGSSVPSDIIAAQHEVQTHSHASRQLPLWQHHYYSSYVPFAS